MTKEEQLREIQKRIAEERGYTDVRPANAYDVRLQGILHADEGRTFLPRWPQEWCDAGVLVDEMCEGEERRWDLRKVSDGFISQTWEIDKNTYPNQLVFQQVGGEEAPEAIARCWCAWKGMDLSGI